MFSPNYFIYFFFCLISMCFICYRSMFYANQWCAVLISQKTICNCNRGNCNKPRLLSRRKSCYTHTIFQFVCCMLLLPPPFFFVVFITFAVFIVSFVVKVLYQSQQPPTSSILLLLIQVLTYFQSQIHCNFISIFIFLLSYFK